MEWHVCQAQQNHTLTIEQSLLMKSVSNPRISPDGRYVAYQVTETNLEENAFETEIWLAVVESGETYQLTNTKKSSSSPKWSPDGKTIAFLSGREDKNQIYLIRPDGGEAWALTKFETGVNAFEWSPDGRYVALTATVPDSKADKERKEKYGDYEVVKGDYKTTHLWMVEVQANGEKLPFPKSLTKGNDFTVSDFSWSPDSRRLAFAATKDADISSSNTSDLYVLSLNDTLAKRIVNTDGPDTNPVWSPDGKQVAFETANAHEFYYYTNGLIATVPAEGGKPTVLSEKFDEDAHLLDWSPEGILFSALHRTSSHLFRLHPSSRKIDRLSGPDPYMASQFSFTRNFKKTTFLGALPNQYVEVCVSKLAPFKPQVITRMGEQLKPYKTANREVIRWKSTDGTSIEGILIKPADFDPKRRYPLLVVIHGGPTGVDRPTVGADRYYPIEMFAAKGSLVLRPNYRGSAGYGEAFRSLNVRNLGVGDYEDVISGVDALISQGIVDKDRIGAMGWSQGGYISAYIATFSDRFKAVSVGAGISNWATYYQNTDITPFTRQYLKATPWSDPDIYRKTSPISYINTAKTPTLIQHGENDKRVPIANAYELRLALEDKGIPVRMVVYKGFGHGINKPKQMRHVMEENLRWFSQWIWGENSITEK
jgi:dipeptidyl aminopeptidase/acylaminoacyl peptidase